MRPVKKVALLHDLCGVGKAALTNMVPVLSVMGIEACPIPTILLSTHTGGYGKPAMEKISTTYIRECADHYVANQVTFDLIFVGYLGSEGMIEAVEYFLSCFPDTEVIIDPIMGDHGRYYTNFDSSYGESMRRLLPYASIIMPNITEGCLLTQNFLLRKYDTGNNSYNLSGFGKSRSKKNCYDKRSLRFWKKGNCPLRERRDATV